MLIGYILLSFSALILFGSSIITSFQEGPFYLFLIVLLAFLLIVMKIVIQFVRIKKEGMLLHGNLKVEKVFFVVLGAVLSYVMNVYLGLGAVVAASLTGLIAAILMKRRAVAIYCGSFVGMVSPLVLHDFYHVIIAAFVAGLILMLSEDVYKGFGGKLGAIAFVSWLMVSAFSNVQLTSPAVLDLSSMLEIVVYSFAASYGTFLLSRKLKHDVVTSSSLVSLLAGLILPAVHAQTGGMFAAVAMSATFAGMSSKEIIRNDVQKVLLSLLVGFMFVYSYSHFGGAGGKLGTIAFGSVLAFKGADSLIVFLKKGKK